MNGTIGKSAEAMYAFVEEMKKFIHVPVVFIDERFSTQEAEKMLISADVRREKRKKTIDKIAAALILEGRLRQIGMKNT